MESKQEKAKRLRKEVALEILSTEKVFVKRLDNIIHLFFDPLLLFTQSDHKLTIPVEDIKLIFGNVRVIYGYNQILLTNLTNRLNEVNSEFCVGDIFFKMVFLFHRFLFLFQTLLSTNQLTDVITLEK